MVLKVEEPFKLLKYIEGSDKWRKSLEKMCSSILHCKYKKHTVIRIDGSGGDDGIDVWVKTPKSKIHIYQCKFFLDNLDSSQKSKISDSFLTAYEKNKNEKFVKWFLVIPKTFNKNELRWWNKFNDDHKDKAIKFKLWDEDKLLNLLKEHKLYVNYFHFEDQFKESRNKFEKDYRQIISKFEVGGDVFSEDDIELMYDVSEAWKASSYLEYRNSKIAHMLEHFLMNLSVVNGIIPHAERPIQNYFKFLMKYYFIPEYYRLCRERDNKRDEKAIELYSNNNAETLNID